MTIINLTSPGKTPAKGDWLEETYGSGRKFNYFDDHPNILTQKCE